MAATEAKKAKGGDGSTLAAVLEKKDERIPYEILEEEKLPGSRVRFKIKLTEEVLAPRLEETLKEFTRNIRIEGFRPGKAPVHLVRNRYEPAAREEAVKRMVGRLAELYAASKGIEPLSQPYLLEYTSDRKSGTTLEVALEVQPEIVITDEVLANITAEVHRVKVDDAFVEKSLERLREQNATFEPTSEGYRPKDGMLVNCTVSNTAGEVIAERSVKDYYSTNLEEEMPADVAAALVGKVKGDRVELNVVEEVEDAAPGTMETVHYLVEVLEVKARTLPTLDDEFAKDAGEQYQSLEDLRNFTREDGARKEETRQREEALAGIYLELGKRLNFDLPRALVENTAQRSIYDMEKRLNQYGTSLRQMDQEVVGRYAASMRNAARLNVKNGLILRQVNKFLAVTPTEEQITEAVEKIAKESGRKPLAVRAQLEAAKKWDAFIEDLGLKITNDALLAKASLEYRDVTLDEFEAIMRKRQEEQAAALRGQQLSEEQA